MRIFDAETGIIEDIKDESEVVVARECSDFSVFAARHPTLGKIVIVEDANGNGVIVETEE